jgi:hypothetical protein
MFAFDQYCKNLYNTHNLTVIDANSTFLENLHVSYVTNGDCSDQHSQHKQTASNSLFPFIIAR